MLRGRRCGPQGEKRKGHKLEGDGTIWVGRNYYKENQSKEKMSTTSWGNTRDQRPRHNRRRKSDWKQGRLGSEAAILKSPTVKGGGFVAPPRGTSR